MTQPTQDPKHCQICKGITPVGVNCGCTCHTPATKPQSKHHLKPFEHKQPDDPKCKRCGQKYDADSAVNHIHLSGTDNKDPDFYGKGLIKGMYDRSVATKPLDELIENLLHDYAMNLHEYANGLPGHHNDYREQTDFAKDAIKALIANAVQEAKIDELKEVSLVMGVVDKVAREYVRDRIATLQAKEEL